MIVLEILSSFIRMNLALVLGRNSLRTLWTKVQRKEFVKGPQILKGFGLKPWPSHDVKLKNSSIKAKCYWAFQWISRKLTVAPRPDYISDSVLRQWSFLLSTVAHHPRSSRPSCPIAIKPLPQLSVPLLRPGLLDSSVQQLSRPLFLTPSFFCLLVFSPNCQ